MSRWKVMSNRINGRGMYIAYRIIDERAPMHSGNIELYGKYSENKEEIERLACGLNERNEREDI